MKPFDMKAAQRGDKIITRDGNEVKFIAYVPSAQVGCQLLVLHGTSVGCHYSNGEYIGKEEDEWDLFMESPEVWVNLYKEGDILNSVEGFIYTDQASADRAAGDQRLGGKAIRIET